MKNTVYLFTILAVMIGCKTNTSNNQENQKGHEIEKYVAHDDHENHEGHDHNYEQEKEAEGVSMESGTITLTEAKSLPISDAALTINNPNDGEIYKKLVKFNFDVANYALGSQTTGENAEHCANSAKGQHIHLILNNSPYTAHYESDFDQEVEEGRYIGLAFLSRSFHESIKTKDAYQLFEFSVGKDVDLLEFEMEDPHMFYSRPKGTYVGKDTEKVLLDFYLTNVDLSRMGYKVEAKINDEIFMIDKWVPYVMEGLPLGENTIELTLFDSENNVVVSPFNPVKRTITLEAAAS